MILLSNIAELFSSISSIFKGNYKYTESDFLEMKKEMLDISETPTSKTDKITLRNDFNSILKDTKKASDKLKSELVNG